MDYVLWGSFGFVVGVAIGYAKRRIKWPARWSRRDEEEAAWAKHRAELRSKLDERLP